MTLLRDALDKFEHAVRTVRLRLESHVRLPSDGLGMFQNHRATPDHQFSRVRPGTVFGGETRIRVGRTTLEIERLAACRRATREGENAGNHLHASRGRARTHQEAARRIRSVEGKRHRALPETLVRCFVAVAVGVAVTGWNGKTGDVVVLRPITGRGDHVQRGGRFGSDGAATAVQGDLVDALVFAAEIEDGAPARIEPRGHIGVDGVVCHVRRRETPRLVARFHGVRNHRLDRAVIPQAHVPVEAVQRRVEFHRAADHVEAVAAMIGSVENHRAAAGDRPRVTRHEEVVKRDRRSRARRDGKRRGVRGGDDAVEDDVRIRGHRDFRRAIFRHGRVHEPKVAVHRNAARVGRRPGARIVVNRRERPRFGTERVGRVELHVEVRNNDRSCPVRRLGVDFQRTAAARAEDAVFARGQRGNRSAHDKPSARPDGPVLRGREHGWRVEPEGLRSRRGEAQRTEPEFAAGIRRRLESNGLHVHALEPHVAVEMHHRVVHSALGHGHIRRRAGQSGQLGRAIPVRGRLNAARSGPRLVRALALRDARHHHVARAVDPVDRGIDQALLSVVEPGLDRRTVHDERRDGNADAVRHGDLTAVVQRERRGEIPDGVRIDLEKGIRARNRDARKRGEARALRHADRAVGDGQNTRCRRNALPESERGVVLRIPADAGGTLEQTAERRVLHRAHEMDVAGRVVRGHVVRRTGHVLRLAKLAPTQLETVDAEVGRKFVDRKPRAVAVELKVAIPYPVVLAHVENAFLKLNALEHELAVGIITARVVAGLRVNAPRVRRITLVVLQRADTLFDERDVLVSVEALLHVQRAGHADVHHGVADPGERDITVEIVRLTRQRRVRHDAHPVRLERERALVAGGAARRGVVNQAAERRARIEVGSELLCRRMDGRVDHGDVAAHRDAARTRIRVHPVIRARERVTVVTRALRYGLPIPCVRGESGTRCRDHCENIKRLA